MLKTRNKEMFSKKKWILRSSIQNLRRIRPRKSQVNTRIKIKIWCPLASCPISQVSCKRENQKLELNSREVALRTSGFVMSSRMLKILSTWVRSTSEVLTARWPELYSIRALIGLPSSHVWPKLIATRKRSKLKRRVITQPKMKLSTKMIPLRKQFWRQIPSTTWTKPKLAQQSTTSDSLYLMALLIWRASNSKTTYVYCLWAKSAHPNLWPRRTSTNTFVWRIWGSNRLSLAMDLKWLTAFLGYRLRTMVDTLFYQSWRSAA